MDELTIKNEKVVNLLIEISMSTNDCLDCVLLKALNKYKKELD